MNTKVRDRYVSDSVTTASPGRLLTLLYDRLILDLVNAEEALKASQHHDASGHLLHAQDIVNELLSSLDVTKWSGGPGLQQIYLFVIRELIAANVRKDVAKVESVRSLLEPLRDAWHAAARATAAA